MDKHPWEIVYDKKQFYINTLNPSIIVKSNKNLFHPENKILDIGCGNGRNSIYIANLGCIVDAFDAADLYWYEKLTPRLKEKINFTKTEINNFKWKNNYYNGIIVTRVIQYLNHDEVKIIFANMASSLIDNGFLIINYAVKGQMQKHKEIKVPKFSHSIKFINDSLKKYFTRVSVFKGSNISIHTNLKGSIKSYGLIAFR